MDVIEPQLEATPEETPEAIHEAAPEAATEATPEVATEAIPEAAPKATPQSDQGVSDAGEASNVPTDVIGGRRARRIPTRVFLANAMEEIRKLDFNKK